MKVLQLIVLISIVFEVKSFFIPLMVKYSLPPRRSQLDDPVVKEILQHFDYKTERLDDIFAALKFFRHHGNSTKKFLPEKRQKRNTKVIFIVFFCSLIFNFVQISQIIKKERNVE